MTAPAGLRGLQSSILLKLNRSLIGHMRASTSGPWCTSCGESRPLWAQQWVERQLDRLGSGRVIEVVTTLDSLSLDQEPWSPLVRQAPDYFRSRQKQMQHDRFRADGYPIGSGTVAVLPRQ